MNDALKSLPCIPIGLYSKQYTPNPALESILINTIPLLNSELKKLQPIDIGSDFLRKGPQCPTLEQKACCLDGTEPGETTEGHCNSSCCIPGDIVTVAEGDKWLMLVGGLIQIQCSLHATLNSVIGLNTLSVPPNGFKNICFDGGAASGQLRADVTVQFPGLGVIADLSGNIPCKYPFGHLNGTAIATDAKTLLKGEITFTIQGNLIPSDKCTPDSENLNITEFQTDPKKINAEIASLQSNLTIAGLDKLQDCCNISQDKIAEEINDFLAGAGAQSLINTALPVVEPYIIPVLLPVIKKTLNSVCIPFG